MNTRHLECYGNKEIEGIIKISGSKNASLPIISSVLLCKNKSLIHNVPRISDITNLLKIFDLLNVRSSFINNDLIIDSSSIEYVPLTMEEVGLLRASYYLIPVLLYYNDEVQISSIGGCDFEKRPIDIHIDVFSSFGVDCKRDGMGYIFRKNDLHPNEYRFKKKSVGGSINAILLASYIKGRSILYNYSHEVEVIEVINVLRMMGVNIEYDDKKIVIEGTNDFKPIEYTIISDRIEAETFMIFALTYGRMILVDINKNHHIPFLSFLDHIEATYDIGEKVGYFQKKMIDKGIVLSFGNEEDVSTDIEPLLLVYLLLNNKKMSLVNDLIYKKRILFMKEFGKACYFKNDKVLINPRNHHRVHFNLIGHNLRETMAYVLYAFLNPIKTKIYGLEYLYRGYEDVIDKLCSLNNEVGIYEDD